MATIQTCSLVTVFACRESGERTVFRPLQFKGAALAHVHVPGKGYGSGISDPLISDLRARGINLIQLNPFGYQPSPARRTIVFDDPTLTDDDLRKEIRAIHKSGMSVMLAPHLWLGSNEIPGLWRSQLTYDEPNNVDEWFATYSKFILHFADLAKDEHVEVFAVGVELEGMAKHSREFSRLIHAIRSHGYRGLLTYECEAWNAANIAFWGDLDFLGLNFYYAYEREVRARDQKGFRELTNFIAGKLREHYSLGTSIGKPVVLTEFGYPGHEMAVSKTSQWPSKMTRRDDDAQETGFAAMREAMQTAGLPHGIVFWKYVTTLDSYEKNNYATDFIIQGKRAERVVNEIVKMR